MKAHQNPSQFSFLEEVKQKHIVTILQDAIHHVDPLGLDGPSFFCHCPGCASSHCKFCVEFLPSAALLTPSGILTPGFATPCSAP